jgi:hypothetical protein
LVSQNATTGVPFIFRCLVDRKIEIQKCNCEI